MMTVIFLERTTSQELHSKVGGGSVQRNVTIRLVIAECEDQALTNHKHGHETMLRRTTKCKMLKYYSAAHTEAPLIKSGAWPKIHCCFQKSLKVYKYNYNSTVIQCMLCSFT